MNDLPGIRGFDTDELKAMLTGFIRDELENTQPDFDENYTPLDFRAHLLHKLINVDYGDYFEPLHAYFLKL